MVGRDSIISKRTVYLLSIVVVNYFLACSLNGPSNKLPECTIISPLSGATFVKGDTVQIEVNASDNDGEIESVMITIDGRVIELVNESPFVVEWIILSGDFDSHLLKADAKDNEGAIVSDIVEITLDWYPVKPENVVDGWEISTVEVEGFSNNIVNEMMREVYRDMDSYLHSLLIVRNNRIVLEEYFRGADREDLFHLQSTGKTFISALIGIAIDKNYINSINEPIYTFFPEYIDHFDPLKKQITIKDLITMTSGLQWNEVDTDLLGSENDNIVGGNSGNYVEYVLGKPVVHEPGTQHYYNSGGVMVLGGIIRNTTEMHADRFAEMHLFGPLGILEYLWTKQADGMPWAHGGLYLRSRDMLKFGLLYLQDGEWEGSQVISTEFVNASVEPFIEIWHSMEYGYLWWLTEWAGHRVYFTSGYGGQNIFVVPDLEIIVAATADYSNSARAGQQQDEVWNLVETYIIPAASH